MNILSKWLAKFSILWVLLVIGPVQAQSITMHAPFSPTGSYQAVLRVLNDGLKERGWYVDFRLTGNAKLSRDLYESAGLPFVLAWGVETNSSKSDIHYLKPPGPNDLVGQVHMSPNYICTYKKDLSESDFVKGKHKVGVDGSKATLRWINGLMKDIGAQHQIITYRGTGAAEIGASSGEVDFVMTPKGASLQASGVAKCLFNTGTTSSAGIPSLASKFSNLTVGPYVGGVFLVARNLSADQLAKLRKDLVDVQKNYVPFMEHAKKMTAHASFGDIASQISFLQTLDKTLD